MAAMNLAGTKESENDKRTRERQVSLCAALEADVKNQKTTIKSLKRQVRLFPSEGLSHAREQEYSLQLHALQSYARHWVYTSGVLYSPA
jgi:hypothetical protein